MGFIHFFSKESRFLRQFNALVDRINELEPEMQSKSDVELAGQTTRFRKRLDGGEKLHALLPEAFATVREVSTRTLNMRHYDVQLIGAMALHEGQIAEMLNGEGKTLVATLAGYLNALSKQGVHIATTNDYLARRDCEWMGPIYRFLGMGVGLIYNGQDRIQKSEAYRRDITYGMNSEFVFDYLRDNRVITTQYYLQRGHHFVIIDEVDSLLIDEARTPLMIAGAGAHATDRYNRFARAIRSLHADIDFEMDEGVGYIYATAAGQHKMEILLGIDDFDADPTGQLANHLEQALRAQFLFHKDVDYVVIEGEVKIVDKITGRIRGGSKWPEGLHQAIEAKEHVLVHEVTQPLATITYQNYFRLYEKVSGMSGTVKLAEQEFEEVYGLSVTTIPPNLPVIRKDHVDFVYRTVDSKYIAAVHEAAIRHRKGQPVLIGTSSIANSERISGLLEEQGISHEVLNAKNDALEASIIAQAGRYGAVTVATNMAGRGTDIKLGGDADFLAKELLLGGDFEQEDATEEDRLRALETAKAICEGERVQVLTAGGLAIIGTERYEDRRIDNQLRGRSGRQGDPGSSQFYLSLEDDLMRLFGGDNMYRIVNLMQRTKMPEDMPIDSGMVSKAIESAQRQVEAMHFDTRKRVLAYDTILERQRSIFYKERKAVLEGRELPDGSTLHELLVESISPTVDKAIDTFIGTTADTCDWDGLSLWLSETTGNDAVDFFNAEQHLDSSNLREGLIAHLQKALIEKERVVGEKSFKRLEPPFMLRILDKHWMNHLKMLDELRSEIENRPFDQYEPLEAYNIESEVIFQKLKQESRAEFLRTLLRIKVVVSEQEDTSA